MVYPVLHDEEAVIVDCPGPEPLRRQVLEAHTFRLGREADQHLHHILQGVILPSETIAEVLLLAYAIECLKNSEG